MRNCQAEVPHAYLHRQPHYITHITLVIRVSGKKSQKTPIRLVRKRSYTAYFSIFFSSNIPDADLIFAVKSLQLFGRETSHMQICDEAREKLESKDLNRRYLETGSEFWVLTGSLCPKYEQKYRSRIMILVTIDSLNVNVNGLAAVSFPLVLAWYLWLFF